MRFKSKDFTNSGALTLVNCHFNRKKSMFVKYQKFCAVRQADYLVIWSVLKISVETVSLALVKMLKSMKY